MANVAKWLGPALIVLVALAASGCAACGPGTSAPGGAASLRAESNATPPPAAASSPPPQATTGPSVTATDTGYLIKGDPGSGDAQVRLKAGTATFHLSLSGYGGDNYALVLTSADGPYSYRASHEFKGNVGMDDVKITYRLPADGTYSVALDYCKGWEVEVVQ